MLTLSKIRELQIKEKEEKSLQLLPADFYRELKEFLKSSEESKVAREIAMDLVERRIRKILSLAPSCVRAGIMPKNLTKEEEELFNKIKDVILSFLELEEEKSEEPKVEEKEDKEKREKRLVIRVKKSLPTFVWRDLKEYTLKEGEIVELPNDLKDFLVKHGYCEVVEI